MFSNISIHRIAKGWSAPSEVQLAEALLPAEFAPCLPSQESSSGWTSANGRPDGPLVEALGPHLFLRLTLEKKSVPASAVKAELEIRCEAHEKTTGLAPGRKLKKELKENILLELLPRAFAKRSSCLVWIDTTNLTLVLGSTSSTVTDEVTSQLVAAFERAGTGIPEFIPLSTKLSPSTAMATWLQEQSAPNLLSIDRELELKATDDSGACVRYASHDLALEEIVGHITVGKVPTKLGMTWNDQVSFILTAGLHLTKLSFLETLFDDSSEEGGFLADAFIEASALSQLIPELTEALGGIETGAPAAESGSAGSPEGTP